MAHSDSDPTWRGFLGSPYIQAESYISDKLSFERNTDPGFRRPETGRPQSVVADNPVKREGSVDLLDCCGLRVWLWLAWAVCEGWLLADGIQQVVYSLI